MQTEQNYEGIILRRIYKTTCEEQFWKKKASSFTYSFKVCLHFIHGRIQPTIYWP